MTRFELRPQGSPASDDSAVDLEWKRTGEAGGALHSDLSPDLIELGAVSPRAVDFLRIATAAYLADQLQARSTVTFSRSLDLIVHLIEPDPWTDTVLDECANLLHFLSGDRWLIEVHADQSDGPRDSDVVPATAERVALLSGGLDSFAGAVLTSERPGTIYVGHWDNPIVKAAQNRAASWFASSGRPLDYVQLRHQLDGDKRENSYRTRAMLFVGLAVAVADSRSADIVEVPENGYTSLNPPLGPERGGALSTRSTHPDTIARMNRILSSVGAGVTVTNPHQERTKGELVGIAAGSSPGDFAAGAAATLSCGKLDGRWYGGGNVHKNCGICVSCLVRRASVLAASVRDDAEYLCDTLIGSERDKLIAHRRGDIEAVKYALAAGLTEEDLAALSPFPDGFDYDAALAMCRRAMEELARVELP